MVSAKTILFYVLLIAHHFLTHLHAESEDEEDQDPDVEEAVNE